MNQIVSNLLVYGKLPEDSILWQLSDICMRLKDGSQDRDVLRTRVFPSAWYVKRWEPRTERSIFL